MPSPKIIAYDQSGKWDADVYSVQTGHTVKLKTNVRNIDSIVWDLYDGSTSTEKIVYHVFTVDGGSGTRPPGEGYVIVKADIVTNDNKRIRLSKRLLIVPRIECEMAFEEYTIDETTEYVDLVGAPLCAQLNMGTPFDGNPAYACGGACDQDCPRYEILCDQLRGTRIYEYGVHRVWTDCRVYGGEEGTHDLCIDLYKDDVFFTNASYPPCETYVTVETRNLKIVGTATSLRVERLSLHMLPYSATVMWTLTHDDTVHTHEGTTLDDFPFENDVVYTINVKVTIPVSRGKCALSSTIACETIAFFDTSEDALTYP